jgi:hypothetical protein
VVGCKPQFAADFLMHISQIHTVFLRRWVGVVGQKSAEIRLESAQICVKKIVV